MAYSTFEEIPVWQESRNILKKIYVLIKTNPKLRNDFSISDQLKRASCSILLNISEGFERSSNTEFAHFLNIAKGSAGEVRAIFYILEDNGYVQSLELKVLRTEIKEISMHLANFRKFLLTDKGRKK